MRNARGNTTVYDYNARGDLTTVTNALGNTMVYAFDKLGRQTRVTDSGESIEQNSEDMGKNFFGSILTEVVTKWFANWKRPASLALPPGPGGG